MDFTLLQTKDRPFVLHYNGFYRWRITQGPEQQDRNIRDTKTGKLANNGKSFESTVCRKVIVPVNKMLDLYEKVFDFYFSFLFFLILRCVRFTIKSRWFK